MGDMNLKKNASVLLYLNISGLDFTLCLMGVPQLLDTQRQHKTTTNIKAKKNCRIITELILQCIE